MSEWSRVVLLGDSITQYAFDYHGWGSHIAGLLQRKCDIFNRGFSGYTTQYIIKILDDLINSSLVQVFFLDLFQVSRLDLNMLPVNTYELCE